MTLDEYVAALEPGESLAIIRDAVGVHVYARRLNPRAGSREFVPAGVPLVESVALRMRESLRRL